MQFVAEATVRTTLGKGAARQVRRAGLVPAVLYGQGASHLLHMDPRAVQKILASQAGGTGLITLTVRGGAQDRQHTAVIQAVQRDPIDSGLLHVDLLEVSMDKPVRAQVPVRLTGGTPAGVKHDGGVLHHSLRELHIECLPGAIPERVDVDVSALAVNQVIHVRDVLAGEGIRVLDAPDRMVANVTMPISEEKLSAMLAPDAAPVPAPDAAPAPAPAPAPSDKPGGPKK